MSKKNSVTKRKRDHESSRRREAELSRKRAEKRKKRRERKSTEDVVMQSVDNSVPPVAITSNKRKRRRINEIRRLANKGEITRDQEKQLLKPLLQ